jgi:hypothetical protein
VSVGLEHDLNLIAAYAEDRLPPAERAHVTAHLAGCAECRAVLAELVRSGPAGAGSATVRHGWRPPAWLPVAAALALAVGAGWMVYQSRAQISTPPTAPDPVGTTPAAPLPSPGTPPPSPAPADDPPPAPPAVTRGAGERSIGGKTFRLEAGEWIDTAYDPFTLQESISVRTAVERDLLTTRVPALRPYMTLLPRFTVVVDDTVYRFDLR